MHSQVNIKFTDICATNGYVVIHSTSHCNPKRYTTAISITCIN